MKQKGRFNYYPSELLRAHVLQMPYQGEDISMIIILPPFEDDSLYTTVQKMTPETIQGIIKVLSIKVIAICILLLNHWECLCMISKHTRMEPVGRVAKIN